MKKIAFKVFNLLGLIVRCFPLFLRKFLLILVRNVPGVIGILLRYMALVSVVDKIGAKVVIFPNVILKYPERMSFGNNISIHEFSYLDAFYPIIIRDNVAIAHRVSIIPFDHNIKNQSKTLKDAGPIGSPIVIESDCWLGAGVILLNGSYCSQRTVLAAGSVLRKKSKPNSLYAGVPADFKKEI